MAFVHAIQVRINGWGIGDYDSYVRNNEIVVGQLASIDKKTGYGTFRGIVLNDMTGQKKEGQQREWKHYLWLSKPTELIPRYVKRYEAMITEAQEKENGKKTKDT